MRNTHVDCRANGQNFLTSLTELTYETATVFTHGHATLDLITNPLGLSLKPSISSRISSIKPSNKILMKYHTLGGKIYKMTYEIHI